jgi:hypothetical protein
MLGRPVCNHNSVVDDPFVRPHLLFSFMLKYQMWSMMPLSTYLPFASPTHVSRNTRWTLGGAFLSSPSRCLLSPYYGRRNTKT